MKRRLLYIFPILFMVIGPFQGVAAELEDEGTWQRKAQRGFLNVALSPIELAAELQKEKKVDSIVPSWVSGLGRGTAFMAGRMVVGVYEMVTFAVPWPDNYAPIVEPEFLWQHFDAAPEN